MASLKLISLFFAYWMTLFIGTMFLVFILFFVGNFFDIRQTIAYFNSSTEQFMVSAWWICLIIAIVLVYKNRKRVAN